MDLVPVNKEIQKKIYDDLFSPWLKEAWQALGNIVWLVTTITLPLLYAKEYTNNILNKNLKNYQAKIKVIPEEERVEVQPEIGVPILEKLNYYNNEKLVNLFTQLLANASNVKTLSKVHPKYISIVENIGEDEAVILEYIYKKHITQIPTINVHSKYKDNKKWYKILLSNYSEINLIDNLNFNSNIVSYIANFISLGILKIDAHKSLVNETDYNRLKSSEYIKSIKPLDSDSEIDFDEWVIDVTGLWKKFLEAIFN